MTAVILLPSLGRGGADYEGLASALRDAGHDVLPYEPTVTGPTLHEIAASVAAVVESAGVGAVHVIGHAFGNRVARCFAADRPDLVRSVTLLAAGGLVEPEPEVWEALGRCVSNPTPEDLAFAFFAPGNDPSGWLDGWSAERARAQSAAVRATPREDWWLAGTAPLLVIQGLSDRVAVPENGRRLVAEAGGRARLVEIEGAGHALLPEQPDAIAAAVLEFLQTQE